MQTAHYTLLTSLESFEMPTTTSVLFDVAPWIVLSLMEDFLLCVIVKLCTISVTLIDATSSCVCTEFYFLSRTNEQHHIWALASMKEVSPRIKVMGSKGVSGDFFGFMRDKPWQWLMMCSQAKDSKEQIFIWSFEETVVVDSNSRICLATGFNRNF